jgi:transcriptional regulator with PAS, ATPase and Fis domain
MSSNWIKEFPAAITVCDTNGIVTEMNEKSASVFENDGGYNLIGKNIFGCHSSASNDKIKEIMNENKPNVYTIEKNGKKKIIYQAPWFDNGEMKGLVELSIEIPFDMPHFIRE